MYVRAAKSFERESIKILFSLTPNVIRDEKIYLNFIQIANPLINRKLSRVFTLSNQCHTDFHMYGTRIYFPFNNLSTNKSHSRAVYSNSFCDL